MMKNKWLGKVVLALCVFWTSSSLLATEKQPLIVGGSAISIGTAPWQVFLRGQTPLNTVSCGGTLIANNFILTAAHCLQGFESYTFTAYAGNAYWPAGKTLPVIARFVHPQYDSSTLDNDIALVKISGTLPATARKITLVNESNQIAFDNEAANGTTNNLFVSGWGATTPNRKNASDNLLGVNMTGIADTQCLWNRDNSNNYVPEWGNIIICANSTGTQGACIGDSGGPLVWKDPSRAGDADGGSRLIGVVSFTWRNECANSNYPDGFSEVSHYLSWISQTLNQNGVDNSDGGSGGGGGTPVGGGGGGGSMGGILMLSLFGVALFSRRKRLS
ncbi:serine protease [Enterovibrio sp. ZSDZ35]|uniref:Serine protease n=1 Tax=Enterovibrio qingdaonensis TaxID=2899818 RepID=A0ABT5QT97_9GAMM|nr:serine protease [Enterovibrio sp. ZSDZ35]MDD1784202.1 serine protease [Enterovibrio sp. ZSDZ35]